MTKIGIAACIATIGVAVPAGWHVLDADLATDGPKLRPSVEHALVDGAEVSLQIDRGVIAKGGRVSATVVAIAESAKDVRLAVTAYASGSIGSDGEGRVWNPPVEIGKRVIKVHAAPGGGPSAIASFVVGEDTTPGHMRHYYVVAEAAKPAKDDGDTNDHRARSEFFVWGGNQIAVAIDRPKVPSRDAFEIGVRVKNTTKRALARVTVAVGGWYEAGDAEGYLKQPSEFGLEAVDDRGDSVEDPPLAPGAERVFAFRVVPRDPETEHFTIIAQAGGVDAKGREVAGLDTTTIDLERTAPAVAEIGRAP